MATMPMVKADPARGGDVVQETPMSLRCEKGYTCMADRNCQFRNQASEGKQH